VPESELVDVPADLSLRELVDVYFLGHGHRGYPVVEGGRPVGLVSIAEVRAVPRDDWDTTKVRDVMTPLDERTRIAPDASVLEALKRLRPGGPSRLVVTQGDHVLGLVSSGSVSRYVELKSLLQEA